MHAVVAEQAGAELNVRCVHVPRTQTSAETSRPSVRWYCARPFAVASEAAMCFACVLAEGAPLPDAPMAAVVPAPTPTATTTAPSTVAVLRRIDPPAKNRPLCARSMTRGSARYEAVWRDLGHISVSVNTIRPLLSGWQTPVVLRPATEADRDEVIRLALAEDVSWFGASEYTV